MRKEIIYLKLRYTLKGGKYWSGLYSFNGLLVLLLSNPFFLSPYVWENDGDVILTLMYQLAYYIMMTIAFVHMQMREMAAFLTFLIFWFKYIFR